MTGQPLPNYAAMKIELGAYAQAFEDNNPSNTPRACMLGAIAFNPVENGTNNTYFLVIGYRQANRAVVLDRTSHQ